MLGTWIVLPYCMPSRRVQRGGGRSHHRHLLFRILSVGRHRAMPLDGQDKRELERALSVAVGPVLAAVADGHEPLAVAGALLLASASGCQSPPTGVSTSASTQASEMAATVKELKRAFQVAVCDAVCTTTTSSAPLLHRVARNLQIQSVAALKLKLANGHLLAAVELAALDAACEAEADSRMERSKIRQRELLGGQCLPKSKVESLNITAPGPDETAIMTGWKQTPATRVATGWLLHESKSSSTRVATPREPTQQSHRALEFEAVAAAVSSPIHSTEPVLCVGTAREVGILGDALKKHDERCSGTSDTITSDEEGECALGPGGTPVLSSGRWPRRCGGMPISGMQGVVRAKPTPKLPLPSWRHAAAVEELNRSCEAAVASIRAESQRQIERLEARLVEEIDALSNCPTARKSDGLARLDSTVS